MQLIEAVIMSYKKLAITRTKFMENGASSYIPSLLILTENIFICPESDENI